MPRKVFGRVPRQMTGNRLAAETDIGSRAELGIVTRAVGRGTNELIAVLQLVLLYKKGEFFYSALSSDRENDNHTNTNYS